MIVEYFYYLNLFFPYVALIQTYLISCLEITIKGAKRICLHISPPTFFFPQGFIFHSRSLMPNVDSVFILCD